MFEQLVSKAPISTAGVESTFFLLLSFFVRPAGIGLRFARSSLFVGTSCFGCGSVSSLMNRSSYNIIHLPPPPHQLSSCCECQQREAGTCQLCGRLLFERLAPSH